jgi:hypothetical protein
LFRGALGIPRGVWRAVAAPLLLATAAAGIAASIVVQLAALTAVLVVALALEGMEVGEW